MRTYNFRNELSVKKECLELFPDGNISREDRQKNRGLFCWIDRNMISFRDAYIFIYNREYIDKRTIIDKSGKNSGRYIDGRHPERLRLRNTKEYKKWRQNVFKRDKFTCQNCNMNKCYIEAHHIKPFFKFPNLRLDIDNGITYCKPCHIELDDFRGKRGTQN